MDSGEHLIQRPGQLALQKQRRPAADLVAEELGGRQIGAQFAAVEIWRFPAPVAVLTFSTLLINARHVLMGASLAPKAKHPLPA